MDNQEKEFCHLPPLDIGNRNRASSPDIVSPTIAEMEDIQKRSITCPECRHYFDMEEHIPRMLQCLHTICNECVKKSIANDTLKCSQCGNSAYVGQLNESGLQKDQHIIDLLKFIDSRQTNSDIECTNCEQNKTATFRCIDCPFYLCPDCYDNHSKPNLTKNHKVFDLEKLKENPYFVSSFVLDRKCIVPGHESIPINCYCSGQGCNLPICTVCASEFHTGGGHVVKNLTEIYGNKRRELLRLLKHISAKIYISKVECKDIESKRENVTPTLSTLERQIDNIIDTMVRTLDERKRELKDTARQNISVIDENLKKRFDELQQDTRSLDSNAELIQSVFKQEDETGLLELEESLIKYLRERVSNISIQQQLKPLATQFSHAVPAITNSEIYQEIDQCSNNSTQDHQDVFSDSYRVSDDCDRESRTETIRSPRSYCPKGKKEFTDHIAVHGYEFPVSCFQKVGVLVEELMDLQDNMRPLTPKAYTFLCKTYTESKILPDTGQTFGIQNFDQERNIYQLIQFLRNQKISLEKVTVQFLGMKPTDEILRAIAPKYVASKSHSTEKPLGEVLGRQGLIRCDATAHVVVVQHKGQKHAEIFRKLNQHQQNVSKYLTIVSEEYDVETMKKCLNDYSDQADMLKEKCVDLRHARSAVLDSLTVDIFDMLKVLRNVFLMCMKERDLTFDHRLPLDFEKCLLQNDNRYFTEYKDLIDRSTLKLLKDGIADIDSLLRSDPHCSDKLTKNISLPPDMITCFSTLTGVVACGLWQDEIKIFVDETFVDGNAEIDIILSQHPNFSKRHKIIRVSNIIATNCLSHGDQLWNDQNKSASLGIFATDKGNHDKLYILTSGHVAKVGQKIYVEGIDVQDRKPFGECIYSTYDEQERIDTDLAVIEVDKNLKHHCDPSYTDKHDTKHEVSLYKNGRDGLTGQRVSKKGAKTGWTKGEILDFHIFRYNREKMVAVQGRYRPFALPGDSGSVVHMRDENDDMSLKLVTMVSGGELKLRKLEDSEQDDEEDLSNIALTIVMNKMFDEANQKGYDLEIYNPSSTE